MKVSLAPGEHRYLCGPHWEQDGMVGTLVVPQP
jgi:plastocyanin